MAVAGSLTYDTKLDTKGFSEGLSKVGNATTTAFKGVGVAIGAVTTAIAGITVAATNAYAEYEQLVGGVEAMFGGMEKGATQIAKVQDTAANAWKDLTMSQNDYYNSFNSTFPLIKSSIEDQNEAIETTNRMLTLESDLANTFGYSMEQASNAINWALKGTYSYLDNLNIGIKGTQEGFLEAAYNAGYMVDDLSELSSSDILDILEKTADQFGVLGRTGAEASKTIQGSVKSMKASFNDLLTSLASGEGIDTAINNLFVSVSTVATNITPVVMTVLEQVPTFIEQLITTIVEQLPTIITSLIPSILNSSIMILNTLIQGIVDNLESIITTAITIVLSLIQGITEALPELIPVIVDAIILIVETLIDNLDMIIEAGIELIIALTEGIFNALPNLIAKLPELIIKLVQALLKLIFVQLPEAGQKIVTTMIDGLFSYWNKMIQKIREFFKGTIFEPIINKVADMAQAGLDLVKGIWNGILGAKDWLLNKIKSFAKTITDGIKKFFGIASPSKIMRDQVGQWLPKGIAVGIDANTDSALNSIDKMNDEIMNKMSQAVSMETAKASFSGTSGSVSQILSANSMIQVENNNKLYLDGEEIYQNQEIVKQRKDLQYSFGGGTSK